MKNYRDCIYILTNPLYGGYVKIGYASDLNSRLASLNTGMLRNFDVYAVYETHNKFADKQFHLIIDDLAPIVRARVIYGQKVQDKEFFKLEPEQAYEIFHHIAIMTGTESKLHRYDEPYIEETVVKQTKRVIQNITEKPEKYMVNNTEYVFISWKESLINHCNQIIKIIGFENFKRKVLDEERNKKPAKCKLFAETEEEMRGLSFHKFNDEDLYLLTNFSAEKIKSINEDLNQMFPECKLKYIRKEEINE